MIARVYCSRAAAAGRSSGKLIRVRLGEVGIEDRVDQVLARREVAVERADADAGFARDRAHVGPEPVRDQDRPGGGDDLQPVPGGIFAPGLLGRFGRPVQLTSLPALPCLICLIRLIWRVEVGVAYRAWPDSTSSAKRNA